MHFSVEDIIQITRGTLVQGEDLSQKINTFCTDSRKVAIAECSIFVALRTEVRDGHSFIQEAYDKGIRCFLVSTTSFSDKTLSDANIILVQDPLRAMQSLAAAHRLRFTLPILGITGSNGKTIIKEWLAILFSKREQVIKNPKSYNSQIGVALSVSTIKEQHTMGLFEAGISQPEEMEHLQNMMQPTIGLFTTIGAAHDINFSTTQEKIHEKLKLFTTCKKLYYCKDHDLVHHEINNTLLEINPTLELRTWGKDSTADLRILEITKELNSTRIEAQHKGNVLVLEIPYKDLAYVENAIHCWFVLLDLGYDHNEIAAWFLELPPVQMRLELLKGVHDCTLINDTYSSDLASLRIALDFLYEQGQHNRYSLIISDILQHSEGAKVYETVVELLCRRPLHKLILIGTEIGKHVGLFEKAAAEVVQFDHVQDFLDTYAMERFHNEAILVKGARRFMLERLVNRLEENIHQTMLSINLSALINNVNTFKKYLNPNTKIMGMVKAFSYGSGSYEIAHTLAHHGVDYLAVAYVDEGILLRKKGIQLPILILNPAVSSLDAMLHYRLEPEIYSLELLKQFGLRLQESDRVLSVHIKLDTGMHRLGIEENDLTDFLDHLTAMKCFDVKSVFSHLVASDDLAFSEFTKKQKASFEDMSTKVEQALGKKLLKHIANSAGALHNEDLQLDMVRLGIGLYGIGDHTEKNELQEVSTLKTHIAQIKNVSRHDTVGYSRAGKLQRDSVIATLNIGYADGYSRSFSLGKGKVWLYGKLAPVVGNVCMDMIMVDVTDIPEAKEGDEVIIFGPQLSVTKLAEWIDTIPYEIVAGVSQRVKRVFYRE